MTLNVPELFKVNDTSVIYLFSCCQQDVFPVFAYEIIMYLKS